MNTNSDRQPAPSAAAEVHTLAAKTQAFWEQLTAPEQALLQQALRAAATGDGADVAGYSSLFPESVLYPIFYQIFAPAPAGGTQTGGSYGGATTATRSN